jgi:tetratricopeptide (TPR) repeat protein
MSMKRGRAIYFSVFVWVLLFTINLSVPLAAAQQGVQEFSTVTAPAPESRTAGAPQPQNSPPAPDILALEARLDALGTRIDTQNVTLETAIGSQNHSSGNTQNLLTVLIGMQFAIIIAFILLAWWLEKKTRKSIDAVETKFAEAKAALDGQFQTALADVQSKIDDACQSLSHTRASQDLLLGGKVLYWNGKPDKALECFETALSFKPNDPEIRKFRGFCLKQMGGERRSEAIADLEFAVSCDTFRNDASIHLDLARMYLSSKAYAKAIDSAKLAGMNDHPLKEELDLVRADALKGLRKYDQAMVIYDSVIAANPGCTQAIIHKAEILSQEKAFDDIVALFQAAISHRGNVGKYHMFLGSAYAQRNAPGDWELALQHFNRAGTGSENDWDLWYHKGRAYLDRLLLINRQGDSEPELLDEAITHFREGEKIFRKNRISGYKSDLAALSAL